MAQVNPHIALRSAEAVLRLLNVICSMPVRDNEREHLTKSAVKWFLNLAAHMGIEGAAVAAEFIVHEDGTSTCEYTPLNVQARIVKDYLLQCELSQELAKG